MLKSLAFRTRLLLILAALALVPAIGVTIAWSIGVGQALPLIGEAAAWERVAGSGTRAIESLRGAPLTPAQRTALQNHEKELGQSLTQARRLEFIVDRFGPLLITAALLGLGVLALIVWRVAGHLSRQLSRPLNELVGWTERIAHGEVLPPASAVRGAPEFETLREHMRVMSDELAQGRSRELEAERLRAFRESARRFAHELKNPLTPIQFALSRLERDAPPSLGDAVEVMRTETNRLNEMSRAFAQFGRLPEGPVSDVDVGEMVRYASRATIPPDIAVELSVESDEIMVRGHHDALQRALSNVLLNAADASGPGGRIEVGVGRTTMAGADAIAIHVRDNGPGIPPERIQTIWEPYITSKPGGTGLGLAIARQAILAHDGSIDIRCPPGGGTVVTFVLPTQRPSAA
jgi:two-component system, NtrC family, nitrogen regulation sensor histidine kinase NtrY